MKKVSTILIVCIALAAVWLYMKQTCSGIYRNETVIDDIQTPSGGFSPKEAAPRCVVWPLAAIGW